MRGERDRLMNKCTTKVSEFLKENSNESVIRRIGSNYSWKGMMKEM